MVTAPHQTSTKVKERTLLGRWYFTGMAIAMLAVSVAGFMPAIAHPATRRAPLSLLAAAHGIVFFAWLLLFLAQSLLAATGRVQWHRRLGLTSVVLLALIVPLSFETTAAMVRRGFDLSGDPHPKLLNPRKRNFLLKHQPAQPHLGACEGGSALTDTTRQRVQVLGKYL